MNGFNVGYLGARKGVNCQALFPNPLHMSLSFSVAKWGWGGVQEATSRPGKVTEPQCGPRHLGNGRRPEGPSGAWAGRVVAY